MIIRLIHELLAGLNHNWDCHSKQFHIVSTLHLIVCFVYDLGLWKTSHPSSAIHNHQVFLPAIKFSTSRNIPFCATFII